MGAVCGAVGSDMRHSNGSAEGHPSRDRIIMIVSMLCRRGAQVAENTWRL